jgi:hypothetical protein
MPSSYTSLLKFELPVQGELSGTWGNVVNTAITTPISEAIAGTTSINVAGTDYTLTNGDGSTPNEARHMFITAIGSPGAARNVICPASSKLYVFTNSTSGGFAMTLKTSAGSGIAVPAGQSRLLYCNGTDVVEAITGFSSIAIGNISGAPTTATASFGTNTTQIATTAFVQAALQALHPVGSIYINATNATNPGTLLGFGTWVAFGAGRVPVGFDSTNVLFDTAEETGGSADAVVVSHTHTITDPGHSHTTTIPTSAVGNSAQSLYSTNSAGTSSTITSSTATTGISVNTAGSSGTNANYQPYITVYMWKRTA